MRWKKRFGVIALLAVVLVAGGLYGLKEYHRKPLPVNRMKPDFSMEATQLAAQFRINEIDANKQYLGKVIRISGIVDAVSADRDNVFNMMIGNEQDGLVSCTMEKTFSNRGDLPETGEQVVVQGICAGMLATAELTRCIIIK